MQGEVANARDGLAPNVSVDGDRLRRLHVRAHGGREGRCSLLIALGAVAGVGVGGIAGSGSGGIVHIADIVVVGRRSFGERRQKPHELVQRGLAKKGNQIVKHEKQ